MKIEAEDFEVINRMCDDRSWHDRVSTREAQNKVIAFSNKVVGLYLLEVKLLHKHGGQPAKGSE